MVKRFKPHELNQMSVIIQLIDDKENDEYSCVMYLNFMLRFINLAFNPKVHAVSPE